MGRTVVELAGQVSGLLTARKIVGKNKRRRYLWECDCECGGVIVISSLHFREGRVTSCGCRPEIRKPRAKRPRGPTNPNWKGGRAVKDGYVVLHLHEHPNASKHGLVMEHVVVMSDSLGRPLLPTERVHHINGVRDDNRIENLELWSTHHPSGQRVEDKADWAVEILRLYRPQALVPPMSYSIIA